MFIILVDGVAIQALLIKTRIKHHFVDVLSYLWQELSITVYILALVSGEVQNRKYASRNLAYFTVKKKKGN